MRKLKLQMQISVDGFVAGPNGEMDWLVWNWDQALNQYVTGITESVDTILLGRVLAEGFIPHWANMADAPDVEESGAAKMNNTHKVVFTKTLQESKWPNTVLAGEDLVADVRRLKAQEGGDLIVYGGGNFVSNLIRHGLIDEYHLFVNPGVLGSGMPIFQEVKQRQTLKLRESRSFECGIVLLRYEPEVS